MYQVSVVTQCLIQKCLQILQPLAVEPGPLNHLFRNKANFKQLLRDILDPIPGSTSHHLKHISQSRVHVYGGINFKLIRLLWNKIAVNLTEYDVICGKLLTKQVLCKGNRCSSIVVGECCTG